MSCSLLSFAECVDKRFGEGTVKADWVQFKKACNKKCEGIVRHRRKVKAT